MIRGAEKAQGGNYNPGVGKSNGGGISAAALGALRGVGLGRKGGNGGWGRE
jgi:hypothetical protein